MTVYKELLRKKWEKKDKESFVFLLFLVFMAVYYGWRLFALTPWYDELYTYYYFISRGPVYAAVHWPLPNNHVGYSVLSAILELFGNAAVGLRGVSWICSLGTLCLLFLTGRKYLPRGSALIPCFVYAPMQLVNSLAVQGRGYALAGFLYLLAFYEIGQIISGQESGSAGAEDMRGRNKKHWSRIKPYVVTACAFVWALYTLPSSVYFVIPLCIAGGSWLLLQRRNRELMKLFVAALISAFVTLGLYTLIWLAIGSNLLAKTPDSGCYGMGHISIILNAPFKALKTGVNYMLDTPYIQSVPREGYLPRFGIWIRMLFESYFPGVSVFLIIMAVMGIGVLLWKLSGKLVHGRVCQEKNGQGFFEWYLLLSFVLTPLMLMIQAALPYYRVFSYFGIPVAFLFAWLLTQLMGWIGKRTDAVSIGMAATAFAGLVCLCLVISPAGRRQYSAREAAIEDALRQIPPERVRDSVICVTDCDQEYLLKYLFDREDGSRVIETSDYVLLDKTLFLTQEERNASDSAGADEWKFYVTGDEIPWAFLEDSMEVCYENERFVLYESVDQVY